VVIQVVEKLVHIEKPVEKVRRGRASIGKRGRAVPPNIYYVL
jgi:hypothetical protein